jgi:hypothetical protein
MASVTAPEDGGRAITTASLGVPTAFLATANASAVRNALGQER